MGQFLNNKSPLKTLWIGFIWLSKGYEVDIFKWSIKVTNMCPSTWTNTLSIIKCCLFTERITSSLIQSKPPDTPASGSITHPHNIPPSLPFHLICTHLSWHISTGGCFWLCNFAPPGNCKSWFCFRDLFSNNSVLCL